MNVVLADAGDLVNFEKGATLSFPLEGVERDPFCPRGVAYVSHVDRVRGVITAVIGDYEHILMNPRDYEALSKAVAKASFDSAGELSPLQVGIAASVTLAGLGWLIARRNALADEHDPESWAAAVVEWIVALVRGLMRANVGSGGPHKPAVPGATPGPATESGAS